MTRATSRRQVFITGWRKYPVFARIVLHVVGRYARVALCGGMPLRRYPRFLWRAFLFLRTVRHNKLVRIGRKTKLQLYVPAYPTPAFWHALEKLYRPVPGPLSVVLSMTRACTYECPHCYQRLDKGADLEIERLVDVVRSMQTLGVSMFDIEGGEPLLRCDRMVRLLDALDDRAEVWMNTTGADLTEEKLDRLVGAGLRGVMVSLHAPDAAAHDAFTGVEGSFQVACDALDRFGERGLFTAINCCPSPETILDGGLDRILEIGKTHACSFVQVIHLKAAGGWLGRGDVGGPPEHIEKVRRLHLAYNGGGTLRGHPGVAAQVFDEQEDLFGCTAGGVDRFYVGADGEVQPCEFLNVSFGNVREESFETIFARMREHFPTPGTDWLCCTEAESIANAIREHGLERTPVPWEVTRELVKGWSHGDDTRLYQRLGIYE